MTTLQRRIKETEAKARRLKEDRTKRNGSMLAKSREQIVNEALQEFEEKLKRPNLTKCA